MVKFAADSSLTWQRTWSAPETFADDEANDVAVASDGTVYVTGFTVGERLVVEANLGLAPGIAFGPEGEGFVRWCFASSEERLVEGVERLRKAVSKRGDD